jgi:hypothetical protein
MIEYRALPHATYSIVYADPDWYAGFPDIEWTYQNDYMCVFRRSIGHIGKNHTILTSRSADGISWTKPKIFQQPWAEEEKQLWHCPKIQRFADNHLELTCDFHDLYQTQEDPSIFTWKSEDNGNTWDGPILHGCYGVMPDNFIVNPNNPNERILPLHYRDTTTKRLKHVIYRSMDDGKTWWAEELLAADGQHDYSEASLIVYPLLESTPEKPGLIAFIRDDYMQGANPSPMQMSISFDFGRNWRNPIQVPIQGHRPIAKLLDDGRIMMTYRDVSGELTTGLWIAKINPEELVKERKMEFNQIFTEQRFYAIEHEEEGTNINDYGYTGWVQNPIDRQVVLVYYTRKGMDNCYIKAVKFDPTIL